ncbi:hypothetical protein G5G92_004175, partial [Escherichia coli]|nr:hypothetical protein [Escherichia coli]
LCQICDAAFQCVRADGNDIVPGSTGMTAQSYGVISGYGRCQSYGYR